MNIYANFEQNNFVRCYISFKSEKDNLCHEASLFRNITLKPIGVSFPSVFLLINRFDFLKFCWLLLFTLEYSDKLCVRDEFSVCLCSKDGMLSAIETAECNFSSFLMVLYALFSYPIPKKNLVFKQHQIIKTQTLFQIIKTQKT